MVKVLPWFCTIIKNYVLVLKYDLEEKILTILQLVMVFFSIVVVLVLLVTGKLPFNIGVIGFFVFIIALILYGSGWIKDN